MPDNVQFQLKFNGKLFEDVAEGMGAAIAQMRQVPGLSANLLSVELRTWLTSLAEQLAARNSTGWPGGTTASSVSRRSGALVDSLKAGIAVSGTTLGSLTATWSGNDYMRAHEQGVTISARGTMYLAIPMPPALRPNGTPIHQNPRDWPDTFVARSRLGNLLIFMKVGAEIVPLYLLKPSVIIPARLGMVKLVEAQLPYFVGRAIDIVSQAILAGK